MEPLNKRLRLLAAQLRDIESELERLLKPGPSKGPLADHFDVATLEEMKAALDNARHSVWGCLAALHSDPNTALETYRMRRVAEMLRTLRDHSDPQHMAQNPAAPSFFREVQWITDEAIRRSRQGEDA